MQVIANLIIAIAVVIIGSLIHHISPSAGQYALVLLVSILAGAVFLSLGQALVGLVKSADSVQAVARVLFAVLILLGLLGQSGALGSFWSSVARWSPVGAVMTLFAGVLNCTRGTAATRSRCWPVLATSSCSPGSASAGSNGTLDESDCRT
jgi:ABC-2 type transport system permease protein